MSDDEIDVQSDDLSVICAQLMGIQEGSVIFILTNKFRATHYTGYGTKNEK